MINPVIISLGSHQYKVTTNSLVKVNRLAEKIGSLIDVEVIYPHNQLIKAEVINHLRDHKISIIKFKRRKHYLKRMGFRQSLTTIKII